MSTLHARMRQRRATAANWTSHNPVLGPGEVGLELPAPGDPHLPGPNDSRWIKVKVGDGTTAWNDLPYLGFGDPDALPTGGTQYRTIWVDQENGDDDTGERENPAKPFEGLHAAVAAAEAGDIIICSQGEHVLHTGDPSATPLIIDKPLIIRADHSSINGSIHLVDGSELTEVYAIHLGYVRTSTPGVLTWATGGLASLDVYADGIHTHRGSISDAMIAYGGELYLYGSRSFYSTRIESEGSLTIEQSHLLSDDSDPILVLSTAASGGCHLKGVTLQTNTGVAAIELSGVGTVEMNAWDSASNAALPVGITLSASSAMNRFGTPWDDAGAAAAAQAAAQAYADGLAMGVFRDAGNYDASSGDWPATGTGDAGAVRAGDTYLVQVAGTIDGVVLDVGDSFRALVDDPGQTASNWARFESNTEQATESYRGTVALASAAEAIAGSIDTKALTPSKWWSAWASAITGSAFLAAVRGTLLTGYTVGTNTALAATDSILEACRKLQGQINGLAAAASAYMTKTANLADLTSVRDARLNISVDGYTEITDETYNLAFTDHIVAFKGLTAPRLLRLPPANVTEGRVFIVVDSDGSCAPARPIIIDADGTNTIEGGADYQITVPNRCVHVYSDGDTKWYVRIMTPDAAPGAASTSAAGLVELATDAETQGETSTALALTPSNLAAWGTPMLRVRTVSLTNITISTALNNGDTINGVTLTTGDIVLVAGQSSAAQNGPYVVGPSPARYHSTWAQHVARMYIAREGTDYARRPILCTAAATGTLGSTAINYVALMMEGDALIHAVQPGKGIYVDTTNPQQPVVNLSGRRRISSAQTTTSTSAAVVPGSAVVLEANKSYQFRAWGLYRSSNASGNPGMGIQVPAGATLTVWMRRGTTAGTINQAQGTTSGALLNGAATMTASLDLPFYLDGEVHTSGTAGDLEMVFSTANASYTTQITKATIVVDEC